ncbi:hypothetical protein JCM12298_29980 [Desulfothermus naphthae]
MKCPGQDTQFWDQSAVFEVRCPNCGKEVEFFKDDTMRKCPHCGYKFLNPKMDFGCAAYCQYAEQCLGNLSPELLAQRKDMLKDRVAIEMKRRFGQDFKRIGHAVKVARYAEQIARDEGADMGVVLIAAYLHDIGIKEAEKKYNSCAAKYQEELGPPLAEEILKKLGAEDALIKEVCNIIAHHHHPGEDETVNFKCLFDADTIVNLEEKIKKQEISKEKVEEIINKTFFTKTGKNLAKKVLIKE